MPKFEVQINRDKRWITQEIHDEERSALDTAKTIVKSRQVDGVRVINDRLGPDGLHRERVVFEEILGAMPEAPIRLNPIEEGAYCGSVEEVYGLESRMTIARLLRKYLESRVLIPSELLYCYSPLSKLEDVDGALLPAAVDRMVTLHCRANEALNAKAWKDELYRWVAEIGRRARKAEGEKLLWKVTLADFRRVLAAVSKCAFIHEEQVQLLRHVIARETYKERNYLGKLEVLLACLSDELSEDTLKILDGFIADTLNVSQVIQEILGSRPNLSNALIGLLDLMEGKAGPDALDDPDTVKVLRRLFKENKLPSGLTVLMERVTREIGGRQPLARNDPTQEHEAFLALMERLVRRDGVAGGAPVAAALTRRYGLRLEQGGATGWRLSIEGVSHLLRDKARRLHYLFAVADCQADGQHMTAVAEEVVQVIKEAANLDYFVDPRLSTTEKLQIMSGLQRALMESTLPEVLRTRVCGRLDDLLARYLVENRVVEKLDSPSDSLRVRAVRLVRFCGSGILIEGKALTLARSRVLHHLRQPNFVEEFTRDVKEVKERESTVREFYRMLAESGFSAG
ncbi:hypothetical protein [Rhodospirillum sp. A1_3_36]|uniref:hypothetical protein n=1 Tax=Rhodospirillum sp. A1_3_36 TaxID=3391666 RepID=UPI0039A72801